MKTFLKLFLSIVLLFPVVPAFSAELGAGKFGLSFFTREPLLPIFSETGSITDNLRPSGISAVYHVTDSFALEPSILWMNSYTEDKSGSYTESDDFSLYGCSIAAFYYGNINNGLYLYAGPRLYVFYIESVYEETGNPSETNEDIGWEASAVIGLKYMFNENFAVFADLGFGFSMLKKTNDYNSNEDTDRNMKLGSSLIGISFYF